MIDRPPPHSEEAERAVLGAILHGGVDTLAIVSRVVDAADFYLAHNRIIFEAAEKCPVIDVQSVGMQIQADGDLYKIGGSIFLSELLDAIVTVVNAEHYACMVKDLSRRRDMIRAAHAVIAEGYAQATDTEEYLASSKKVISNVGGLGECEGAISTGDSIDDAITAAIDSEPPAGVIKTGMIGDIYPGILTLIAGRPGMGKSTLSLNVAANSALAGHRVLYYSMEETRILNMFRLISRFADVDHSRIIEHSTNDSERHGIQGCKDVVGCMPLYFDGTGGLTPENIRHRCIVHQSLHGLDLVIIDNLSNVRKAPGKPFDVYTRAVSEIAELPKELDVPVILISQLNREVEKRENRVPMKSDLRQTGELEQLAKYIVLVMRESEYPDRYPNADEHEMNIYIAKNTNGRCGKYVRYCDMSRMLVKKKDVQEHAVWAPPANPQEGY